MPYDAATMNKLIEAGTVLLSSINEDRERRSSTMHQECLEAMFDVLFRMASDVYDDGMPLAMRQKLTRVRGRLNAAKHGKE